MSSDSIADTSAAIHAAVLAAVDIGIDAELSVQIAELIHAARMPSATHPSDEESPTHFDLGIAVGSSGAVVTGGASTRDGIEAAAANPTTDMSADSPAHLGSQADRAKKVAAAAKVRAERNARSAIAAADERRTTLVESDLARRRAAFMDAFDPSAWTAEIDELVDDPDLTWQDQ